MKDTNTPNLRRHNYSARTLLLFVCLVCQPLGAQTLTISDAWINYLPPVIPLRSGYMIITNQSADAIKITRVESEVFTQIEVHETVTKNGMMSMRPVLPLTIVQGTTVKLMPGGLHLMMMKPHQQLNPGQQIEVILHFDSGESQKLQMTVKKQVP